MCICYGDFKVILKELKINLQIYTNMLLLLLFTWGTLTGIISSSSAEPGETAGVLLRTPAPGWTLLCAWVPALRRISEPPGWSSERGGEYEPTPSRDRFMEDSESRRRMLRLNRCRLLEALWFTSCGCCGNRNNPSVLESSAGKAGLLLFHSSICELPKKKMLFFSLCIIRIHFLSIQQERNVDSKRESVCERVAWMM